MMQTTRRSVSLAMSALVACASSSLPARAQQGADEFYRGKTIFIVVGYASGGGYDIYARLLSRHLADHIPGKPTIVVQNMPGAATLTAANYVYSVAPKDGTVIAATDQNIPLFQLLGGKGVRFDVSKFGWLGSIATSNGIAMTWAKTGLKTLDDVKTRSVSMGTTGNNDDAYIYAKTLNALLGTDLKVITGYSGTSSVNIAMENGEVEAMGRATYYGFRSQREDWLRDHKVNVVVQFGLQKQPELADVPMLLDLVKAGEDRQFATLVSIPPSIGYTSWLAPGVPADRQAILEKAFAETMSDPAFLEDAKVSNTEVRPKSADQLRAVVRSAEEIPQAVRDRAATTLGWN